MAGGPNTRIPDWSRWALLGFAAATTTCSRFGEAAEYAYPKGLHSGSGGAAARLRYFWLTATRTAPPPCSPLVCRCPPTTPWIAASWLAAVAGRTGPDPPDRIDEPYALLIRATGRPRRSGAARQPVDQTEGLPTRRERRRSLRIADGMGATGWPSAGAPTCASPANYRPELRIHTFRNVVELAVGIVCRDPTTAKGPS